MTTTHDHPQGLFKEVWEVPKVIFEGLVSQVALKIAEVIYAHEVPSPQAPVRIIFAAVWIFVR